MENMKSERLLSFILALILAFATLTILPAGLSDITGLDFGITASAAESDFTYATDSYGGKYITGYTGKGGDITLPKGVYLGEAAFKDNTNITSVTFPEDYSIGKDAFLGCTALKKVVVNGDAINIGAEAFAYCLNLESVTINGSIEGYIGYWAFYDCQSLKTFKVTKDEKEFVIGENAFENCYSLTSVTIPSKCTAIYSEAFLNCCQLKSVTVPANTKFDGERQFGYAEDNAWSDDAEYFVADGKTYISPITLTTDDLFAVGRVTSTANIFWHNYDGDIPEKITLTVTKGSDAEKYAKANGVAYKYASGSTVTTSASSAKTSSAAAAEAIETQKIGFTAKATSNKIVLRWDEFADADAYVVYRYNTSTGTYEKYKAVGTAKCTITGLSAKTSYKFKVVAVKKSGSKYTPVAQSTGATVKTKAKSTKTAEKTTSKIRHTLTYDEYVALLDENGNFEVIDDCTAECEYYVEGIGIVG
jgi:hypothetical protein